MSEQTQSQQPLFSRTIAVPETRQLDVLAGLLERRGAAVVRCPLIAIRDSADETAVTDWIRRCVQQPQDLLILFTGEGVDRLVGFAERAGLRRPFIDALASTLKLCRGPKPGRALRRLGLRPDIKALEPTTDGVIATLADMDLQQKRIGLQLYGDDPNAKLTGHLQARGADVDCVAPYVYASAAEDEQVIDLINRIGRCEIDAIAFTSKTQVLRLCRIAEREALTETLMAGLGATRVAAIGPVVAEELRAAGIEVDAMPEDAYFLKPLVNELSELLAGGR